MAQEADVSRSAREAGMVGQNCRFFHDVQIGVKNDHAVERYFNAAPIGDNLLFVPLAQRLAIAGACGYRIVDGAVILFGPNLSFVHRIAVVENLNLHSLVGGVPFERRTNAYAVVCARSQEKLKPKCKIAIFFFSKEVAAACGRANDFAILDDIAGAMAANQFPSIQGLSIEQRGKAGLVGAGRDLKREKQNSHDLVHRFESTAVRAARPKISAHSSCGARQYVVQITGTIDSTMRLLLHFCAGLALAACLPLPAVAAIQAGVATLDITPKESIWLGGYAARTKPSQGVRQRIFAKALALRDEEGTTAVLVTADILGFTQELISSVAMNVESRFQLPRRLLLFNASHTHSAPVIGDALGPAYPLTDADRAMISRYTAWFGGELVELVGRSIGNLQPAQLSFGQGLAGLAVNRRRVGNPEYPNVTDPDLPVLLVRGTDGAIRAIVFGYACHNTTLDDLLVSGDWAGYAQSEVEAQFAGSVALFVQNCGADANPLPRRTEDLAIAHGRLIAAAVAEVVQGQCRKLDGPITAAFREIDLPLEEAPSRQAWEQRAASGSDMERRHASMTLRILDRDGRLAVSHRWQAQAWRIGPDFTLLALGGEVVADYALRFKSQYGFRNLWVAGYSNDVFAYIPSRRVWQEGGYEGDTSMIPYGLPARFQSSVEDRVVSAVEDLMKALDSR